jgi:2'-5' RNA ligase
VRLFVASSFEPAFTASVKAIADYAAANAGRGAVKWVAPENFHLTYAFLGDLPKAEQAVKGLDAGLEGLKAFDVSLGGFGVFPSARRPSVLWVGIGEGAQELRSLAEKLAAGLAEAGLMFENRFEPHVTIGRVKGELPDNFTRRVADFAPAKRARSRVASVELMESALTPAGPVYRQVYSRRLL